MNERDRAVVELTGLLEDLKTERLLDLMLGMARVRELTLELDRIGNAAYDQTAHDLVTRARAVLSD